MENKNILYSFDSLMQHGLVGPDGERHDIKKVLIPMIQRPYAQGRKSRKDIRDKFIAEIFECITSSELMELNFVYGTLRDGVFELLDGQQRLTTLFLLHWYIATKDGEKPEYLNKFTYETRTSSTNFINKLVQQGIALNGAPSEEIRAAYWYSKSFDKDTTIDSMLRMLDCIDEHYKKAEHKPTYADLSKLQFYVLELDGFGLTEELFIKMNARGLQLTPFENFKADLVGYLKKQPRYQVNVDFKDGQGAPYWLYFSSKLDGAWQDIFWTKPSADEYENSGSKDSDRRFFRFVQRYIANKLIDPKVQNVRTDETFKFFSENTEIERHGGFALYKKVFEEAKASNDFDIIKNLDKVLCFLSDSKVGDILQSSLQAPWEDTLDWLPWNKEVSRRRLIILAAMTEYIEQVESLEKFDEVPYLQWMRIVHSMVENEDINNLGDQITLTRLLKNILLSEDGVATHPYSSLVAFNEARSQDNRFLDNEAIKAKAILSNSEWENAFKEAERDKFLTGFVTVYYEEGMDVTSYRQRSKQVSTVFDIKGVSPHFRKNNLLMRAVYCRNYNWIDAKKDKYLFTVTNDASERNLKALTIWNDFEPVKDLFCHLLDCKAEAEMDEYLAQVLQEEHELILNTRIWDKEEQVKLLNLGYKRLFQTDEMQPLNWLYDYVGEKSMRLWIGRNARMAIYKGNVNCMYINNDRHKFVPALIEATKDDFDLMAIDGRQPECLERFGNYNESSVWLISQLNFCEGLALRVNVDSLFEMAIKLRSKNKQMLDTEVKLLRERLIEYDDGTTAASKDTAEYGEYASQVLAFSYHDRSFEEIIEIFHNIKKYFANAD